jgi:hypothetical protein
MGSLCRGAGEGGHAVGEVAFAVGDGLLVAHRSVDVAVAGELHEFLVVAPEMAAMVAAK